jgi:hypothetical protein
VKRIKPSEAFDDSGDGVTLLELEFVSATARDDALNEIVPDPNDNMSHDNQGGLDWSTSS